MLGKWLRALSPFVAAEGDRMSESAREAALDVLERHKMKAYMYFPAIGHRNDPELSHALDVISAAGYIITDSSGGIVGKVANVRLSSTERAEQKRATFKIVE